MTFESGATLACLASQQSSIIQKLKHLCIRIFDNLVDTMRVLRDSCSPMTVASKRTQKNVDQKNGVYYKNNLQKPLDQPWFVGVISEHVNDML